MSRAATVPSALATTVLLGDRFDREIAQFLPLVHETVDSDAVLLLVQLAIAAAEGDQLPVSAPLGDFAALEHENLVGVANRGKAVSDDEGGAAFHQGVEAVLDQRLGLTIER